MKRKSGYASTTLDICAIFARAGSSRTGLSAGEGALFSSSLRLKLRKSRRDVTTTVSNRPDFTSRRVASCCRPMPSESIATSEATPTEIPTVVSELRNTDSRRLRTASSARS